MARRVAAAALWVPTMARRGSAPTTTRTTCSRCDRWCMPACGWHPRGIAVSLAWLRHCSSAGVIDWVLTVGVCNWGAAAVPLCISSAVVSTHARRDAGGVPRRPVRSLARDCGAFHRHRLPAGEFVCSEAAGVARGADCCLCRFGIVQSLSFAFLGSPKVALRQQRVLVGVGNLMNACALRVERVLQASGDGSVVVSSTGTSAVGTACIVCAVLWVVALLALAVWIAPLVDPEEPVLSASAWQIKVCGVVRDWSAPAIWQPLADASPMHPHTRACVACLVLWSLRLTLLRLNANRVS